MRPTDPDRPSLLRHPARAADVEDSPERHPHPGGMELPILCASDSGLLPTSARVLAGMAVVESVVFGLVTRHAYEAASSAAVPLTFTFLFLVPMAAGYRTVASDRARVGLLPPSVFSLMLLTAAVAQGGAALLVVLLLTPMFMLMALIGGALAWLVRGLAGLPAYGAALLDRAAASLRREVLHEPVPKAFSPHPVTGRVRPVAAPRDAWRQIIIHVPR